MVCIPGDQDSTSFESRCLSAVCRFFHTNLADPRSSDASLHSDFDERPQQHSEVSDVQNGANGLQAIEPVKHPGQLRLIALQIPPGCLLDQIKDGFVFRIEELFFGHAN
jgi:hypothetical protein